MADLPVFTYPLHIAVWLGNQPYTTATGGLKSAAFNEARGPSNFIVVGKAVYLAG